MCDVTTPDHRPRVRPPLPAQRLVRGGVGPRGGAQPAGEDGRRPADRVLPDHRAAGRSRSPTRAGTGWRRCRWASSAATTRSCAATTASATTPTAAPRSCRRRTRSTPARRCTPTRWSSGTATSGCGPATRRWPTRTRCRTCTGTTTPHWAGDGKTIHVNCSYQLIVDNLMDLTHEQFVHGSSIGHDSLSRVRLRGHPHRQHGDGHEVDARHRPAAVLEAQPAGPLPRLRRAWSTAGRSSTTPRRRRSRSTSAWPRPGPARPRATAARASPAP